MTPVTPANNYNMLKLLYTNENGDLLVAEDLEALGGRGDSFVSADSFIPMPAGATLASLPGRVPLGKDKNGNFVPLGEKGWPVAALLPQGFTRTLLPAYVKGEEGPDVLPLLGYTAVALDGDTVKVAAIQTDEHRIWHPDHYNTEDLPRRIRRVRNIFPKNRIVSQLAHCSLNYGCFTAQNFFYRRWEGGLPVSPACNAQCVGCISEQQSECCPSPQGRIDFRPKVREIAEVGAFHLSGKRKDNIISFGQGCEGEPSLEAERIAKSIQVIRDHTQQGTININTNAGNLDHIRTIVDSGLDTMRVSLFSAKEEHYQRYYRPRNYTLADVERSIAYGVDHGVYVSLNLLAFPGFTDREEEIAALLELSRRRGLQKVQIRNLNIDCDYFYDALDFSKESSLGMDVLIQTLENNGIAVGNYSRPKKS